MMRHTAPVCRAHLSLDAGCTFQSLGSGDDGDEAEDEDSGKSGEKESMLGMK